MDVVRLLGGGLVRSVRAMAWQLAPDRPTEGSHMTFVQFVDGSTASIVYSGYDYFDSDEFHGWVGELGADSTPGGHGASGDARAKAAGGARASGGITEGTLEGKHSNSD